MPSRFTFPDQALERWARRAAFSLKLPGTYNCPSLFSAIRRTSLDSLSAEERQAIGAIEEVRTSLEQDHRVISTPDYGAKSLQDQDAGDDGETVVIRERKISEVCKRASKDRLWCTFLFQLIRQIKPTRCIEMGTCLGISASYISSALKLNGQGRLVTLEGSPEHSEIARDTFRRLGLDNVTVSVGRFDDTLVPALEDMGPVGFAFVDGFHDEDATCQYFEEIRGYLDARNVMIFDDIRWSEGMKRAWRYVANRSEAYNLGPLGACIDVAAAARPEPSAES